MYNFSVKFILGYVFIVFAMCSISSSLKAQTKSNSQFITEAKAISIAKHNQLITKLDPTPQAILDTVKKVWQISSMRTKHVKVGKCNLNQPKTDTCNCKHTNGCTDIWQKKIRINAINGKVISKKTTRKRYPNYE